MLLQTQDTDRRFSGLSRLYGEDIAQRIRRAHVVVVGIGGVGSWAAEALARSGVGKLTLIDMDHVSESNINRQLHALSTSLGRTSSRLAGVLTTFFARLLSSPHSPAWLRPAAA